MYYALLKWHTKKVPTISCQETLDEAKDRVEEVTGLRPTNGKLLEWALRVPPRLRDHMRCMLIGKIKCGPFWNKGPTASLVGVPHTTV